MAQILLNIVVFALIATAISVRGSPWNYFNDRSLRDRRNVPCTSCNRDCAAALSPSWYENFEQPFVRNDRSYKPQTYAPWNQNQGFTDISSYPYTQLDRSSRSMIVDPRGIEEATYKKYENPYKRINPFDSYIPRGNRQIDSYRTPKNPTFESDSNERREEFQNQDTRIQKPLAALPSTRNQKTPRQFSNYFKIESPESQSPEHYNRILNSKYSSSQRDFTPIEVPLEYEMPPNNKNDRASRPTQKFGFYRRNENPQVIDDANLYRVAKDPSIPPRNEDLKSSVRQEKSTKVDAILLNEKNLEGTGLPENRRTDRFSQSKERAARDFLHEPEIKHNPFQLPRDLNVLKMIQGVERQMAQLNNAWRNQEEFYEGELEESGDYFGGKSMEDEGAKIIEGDTSVYDYGDVDFGDLIKQSLMENWNNDDERHSNGNKTVEYDGAKGDKATEGVNSMKEKRQEILSNFDPDFMEEIEDPPMERSETTEIATKDTATKDSATSRS